MTENSNAVAERNENNEFVSISLPEYQKLTEDAKKLQEAVEHALRIRMERLKDLQAEAAAHKTVRWQFTHPALSTTSLALGRTAVLALCGLYYTRDSLDYAWVLAAFLAPFMALGAVSLVAWDYRHAVTPFRMALYGALAATEVLLLVTGANAFLATFVGFGWGLPALEVAFAGVGALVAALLKNKIVEELTKDVK